MALTDKLTAIGDAIRTKTGTTEAMTLEQMATAINNIVAQEDLSAEMTAQDSLIEQIQTALIGKAGGGSGGGAEVPTCTVRFVPGEEITGTFVNQYPADWSGYYAYTKCVDGVTSLEKVGDVTSWDSVSDFDVTLENVVCGSIIHFVWSHSNDSGGIAIKGSETAKAYRNGYTADNETTFFVAPLEDGAVCTITLSSHTEPSFGE